MKIAHIADSHLRTAQYGSNSRGTAFYHGLKSAIDAAYAAGAKVIIHSGDLLDKRPTAYTMMDVYDIHQLLKSRQMTMLHISGNHDDVPYEAGHSEYHNVWSRKVSWMSLFKCDNTHFGIQDFTTQYITDDTFPEDVSQCIVEIEVEPNEFVSFAFIPSCNKSVLLQHLDTLQKFIKEREIKSALNKPLDFIVWHGPVLDFVRFQAADAMMLPDFPQGLTTVYALGDLHIHEIRELDDGTLVSYPGSTCMCAADEAEHKQLIIYDIDTEKKTMSIQHVPFFTYPIRTFVIDSEEDLEKLDSELKNGDKATEDALWNIYEDARTVVILKVNSNIAEKTANQVSIWARTYKCVFRCQTAAEVAIDETDEDYVYEEDNGITLHDFAVEFSSNFTPVKNTELVGLCSELANSQLDIETIITNTKNAQYRQ